VPLEETVLLTDSRQIRIDLGLGDWVKDGDVEPQRCVHCGARQPWTYPQTEPQKAETD
jgi:hypothetical protein